MLIRIAFCLSVLLSSSVLGALVPPDCAQKLLAHENDSFTDKKLYDECGFTDSFTVWSKWAPFASSHNAPKMLLEVCRRFPEHLYHNMYCEKAYQTGYAPAIAYRAREMIEKGDMKQGVAEGTKALKTGALSKEEEGVLLEAFAIYYLKANDERFKSYLEAAAERRSAMANHITAILLYASQNENEETNRQILERLWRAILLGCSAAEESLGLYHLARQNQITRETAQELMKDKMYTCEATEFKEKEDPIDETMLSCRCKAALEAEKKLKEKPFILKQTENGRAILEDGAGQVYNVGQGDNLPGQGVVSEIHKTGVVLTYPDDRIILNQYQADVCVSFCNKHHITENLSSEQMRERLKNQGPRIKPYHLTFTAKECENIAYYAATQLDADLPYVGKTECANVTPHTEPLNILQELEQAALKSKARKAQKQEVKPSHEDVKERLKLLNNELFE